MSKKNYDQVWSSTQIKFTAMLKTAVHNKKINYMEKRYNSKKNQSSLEAMDFLPLDAEDFVQSIVDADLLKIAIDNLTEKEKRIFTYRLINGLSLPEIADRENLTYMAVALVLHRTLEKLRKIIRSMDDDF